MENNFVIISTNFHYAVMFMFLMNLQCTFNYCSRNIQVPNQNFAEGRGLKLKTQIWLHFIDGGLGENPSHQRLWGFGGKTSSRVSFEKKYH